MNRRSFIATITALAGVALAKIKAPARPKYAPEQVVDNLMAHYAGDFRLMQVPTSDEFLFFTQNHVWVMDADGIYKKWQPTPTQKHLLGYKPIE